MQMEQEPLTVSCVLKKLQSKLLCEHLCHGPPQCHLCAKLLLIKYHNDPFHNSDERIEIFANCLINTVKANGLTIAAYWGIVEEMMSVLTTFASVSCVCVQEKRLKVDAKFARFRRIRESFNIALTLNVANCCGLLNIRNHHYEHFLRYCFSAPYHLHHQISLDRIDNNYKTTKTYPNTYNQLGIHQQLGEFDMPMPFEDFPEFAMNLFFTVMITTTMFRSLLL